MTEPEPAVPAYADPEHPGNGEKYRTGKICIEPGCKRPAGTMWSPHWCFECNVERIKRVNAQIEDLLRK